jgi:hypothetical protein
VIVIADAGLLLHLFWVDASAWALPPRAIHVVPEVWQEVEAHAPDALQDPRVRRVIQLVTVSPQHSAIFPAEDSFTSDPN